MVRRKAIFYDVEVSFRIVESAVAAQSGPAKNMWSKHHLNI